MMMIRALEIAAEELRRQLDELEHRAVPFANTKAEIEQARLYLNRAAQYGNARELDKALFALLYVCVCFGVTATELEQAEKLKQKIDALLGWCA